MTADEYLAQLKRRFIGQRQVRGTEPCPNCHTGVVTFKIRDGKITFQCDICILEK